MDNLFKSCEVTIGQYTLYTEDAHGLALFARTFLDHGPDSGAGAPVFIGNYRTYAEAVIGHEYYRTEILAGRVPVFAAHHWNDSVKPWEVRR